MRSSKEKLNFWQQHIDDQKQSGISVQAYCDQHKLKKHQFTYYRRRLRGSTAVVESKARFLPVAVTVPKGLQMKIDGVELEFSHSTPASWVAKVIWEVGRLHANS